MKKLILSSAIATVLATSANVQAAKITENVELYGKFYISLTQSEESTGGVASTDAWKLNSHASRIGIKGKKDLGNGLTGIFKYEFQASADDFSKDSGGDKNSGLTQRNTYIGLKGSFGKVIAGIHDTPLKMSQGKIDQFNDLEGDIKKIFTKSEKRLGNSIIYMSPSFSGIKINAGLIAGEGVTDHDGDGDATNDDSFSDAISIAASYKNKGLYAAVALDNKVKGFDNVRLSAQYKIGKMAAIGAIYNRTEDSTSGSTGEESGFLISAYMNVGSGKIKLQYGTTENDINATTSTDLTTLSVGYDHKLAKSTKLYAYYTNNETDKTGSTSDKDNTYLGFGVVHKF
ncbi:MAG: porin [Methylococcales bacterium]|nr:porin [Methylococcales bacterium]